MNSPRTFNRREGQYLRLLIALVALMLIEPLVGPSFVGQTIVQLLFTMVLLTSFLAVLKKKSEVAIPIVYIVITLISAWTAHFFHQPAWLAVTTPFFGLLLLIHVVLALIRHVFTGREQVTPDILYGAVDIYLLIALIFAFLAALVEAVAPESYAGKMVPHTEELTMAPYLYLSLNNLTGIGFAAVVPTSRLAMMLGFVEAIAANMYLAILVARLVGMQMSQRRE